MKRVWYLARKDVAIFLTDPVAIGLAFIVPMVMILVFGFVFGGQGKDGLAELNVLAVNEDTGPGGARLVQALDGLEELKLIQRSVKENTPFDSASASALVAKGSYSAALVIPRDFSDGVADGELRAHILEDTRDPVTAGVLLGLMQKTAFETFPMLMPSAMMSGMLDSMGTVGFNSDLAKAIEKNFGVELPDSGMSFKDMVPRDMLLGDAGEASDSGSSGPNLGAVFNKVNQITRTQVVGQNVVNPAVAHTTAGTAVMFMLFGVGAIAASLLREMHTGTATRLLLMGATSGEILLSKLLYAVVLGSLQLFAMMVYGWLIFSLQIWEHLTPMLVMIVVTAVVMSSVGLIISALSRTEEQAAGFQVVIILSMSAIGGAMFPSFMLPGFIKTISKVTPVYWAMQGFNDIFWRNQSLSGILLECGICLGMAALMTTLAVMIFRRRLANELG
ncbi:MAG: ABC transporter permease [Calditrichaeota bacterium]|nr:ABC transporter permease [Calditrichota bacterium]MCB9365605.1 ABC transporter permease [Calditrichota bacterium]